MSWLTEAQGVYQDLKADGFEITVRFGGDESTEWDPDDMEYTTTGDTEDYTTYGLKKSYSARDIDGTVVQQGDTMLIFPAYGVDSDGTEGALPEITTATRILISSVEQNVVNLSRVDPGNVAVMYQAQVRK